MLFLRPDPLYGTAAAAGLTTAGRSQESGQQASVTRMLAVKPKLKKEHNRIP